MIDIPYSLALIAIMALVTLALRFLPFLIFAKREIPKALIYLGEVLPGAIVGMLVIYCFKGTAVLTYPYALPEIIAVAVVVGLYIWRKNTLLSIGVGTVLYMILMQMVFI